MTEEMDVVDSDRKVNLMIVTRSLWIGGAETVIRHLAETIDRQRFNVTVCYLRQRGTIADELARAGVDIVGATDPESPGVDYLSFRKLRRVVLARRVDVLHTHTTHALVDSSLCKLLKPGLKLIHTFHFGNYPHTRPRIIWMERLFSRLADRLCAVGEVQRQQIRSLFGFADERIATVWNGVRLPALPGDASFRERVGAGDRILIGTVATLIRQKGLFDLLTVAKLVQDSGREVLFAIVGEGELRTELEKRRSELGLEDTVVLTGWVTGAAEACLPALDVFFQPSLWEAMSVVILEAMAAAKPVVATRVGENGHVIEDGVDGVLVDPGDVQAMAAALIKVIDDGCLRSRLGNAARRKIEGRFTVEHMSREYERAYLEMLR